jgi:hypothetical protein
MTIVWASLSVLVYIYACISTYKSISPIDSSYFTLKYPIISSLIPLFHPFYLIVLYMIFINLASGVIG